MTVIASSKTMSDFARLCPWAVPLAHDQPAERKNASADYIINTIRIEPHSQQYIMDNESSPHDPPR
ncbi:MAG: hypothetical protein AAAC49_15720, partial [Rhizobium leguminosarum]